MAAAAAADERKSEAHQRLKILADEKARQDKRERKQREKDELVKTLAAQMMRQKAGRKAAREEQKRGQAAIYKRDADDVEQKEREQSDRRLAELRNRAALQGDMERRADAKDVEARNYMSAEERRMNVVMIERARQGHV